TATAEESPKVRCQDRTGSHRMHARPVQRLIDTTAGISGRKNVRMGWALVTGIHQHKTFVVGCQSTGGKEIKGRGTGDGHYQVCLQGLAARKLQRLPRPRRTLINPYDIKPGQRFARQLAQAPAKIWQKPLLASNQCYSWTRVRSALPLISYSHCKFCTGRATPNNDQMLSCLVTRFGQLLPLRIELLQRLDAEHRAGITIQAGQVGSRTDIDRQGIVRKPLPARPAELLLIGLYRHNSVQDQPASGGPAHRLPCTP